ncbi:MAG: N-acetyltransferase, partial [Candidatus Zixiibacteriota bacterium]
ISERSKVTIRGLNMRRYSEEVDLINRLYNTAWETNWGFVPMTPEEFRYTAAQMKQIIDPDLALIAVVGDKPIGFSLSLPDLNQALKYLNGKLLPLGVVKLLWHTKIRNKVRGLRTIIMGILPEFQKKGIDLLMHVQTYERGVRKGYRTSELSWVLESNEQMHAVAEGLGARRYKTYRLVEIPI